MESYAFVTAKRQRTLRQNQQSVVHRNPTGQELRHKSPKPSPKDYEMYTEQKDEQKIVQQRNPAHQHAAVHQQHNAIPQPHNTIPQQHNTIPQPHNTISQPHNTIPQPHHVIPQPHNTIPQPHNIVHHQRNTRSRGGLAKPKASATGVLNPNAAEFRTIPKKNAAPAAYEQKKEVPCTSSETQDKMATDTPQSTSSTSSKIPKGPQSHPEFPIYEFQGKYEFIRYLGRGSYGYVCEAKCVKTGQHVAVKKIKNVFNNKLEAKRLLRELRILRVLKDSVHVINVVDILPPPSNFDSFNTLLIVFEFVDTDMSKLIVTEQYLTSLHVKYLLWQLLAGLKYIHSCNIVHRDLKPANILVNENCGLKICDFGLARGLSEKHLHRSVSETFTRFLRNDFSSYARCGGFQKSRKPGFPKPGFPKPHRQLTRHVVTRWYRAPEILLKTDYTTQVDMWSVGCILAELLSMQQENVKHPRFREPLFPGSYSEMSPCVDSKYRPRGTPSTGFTKDQLQVIFDVIGTPSTEDILNLRNPDAEVFLRTLPKRAGISYKQKFPAADDDTIDLLNGLLQFDPTKRYTVDEALAHPFLAAARRRDDEKTASEVTFEFEDVDLSGEEIKSMVIDEIRHYNPSMQIIP